MQVENIPDYEQNFDETGVDSEGKRHKLTNRQVQIPNGNSIMKNLLANFNHYSYIIFSGIKYDGI